MAAAFGTMACGHVCHLGSAFVGVVAVQGMAERNSILTSGAHRFCERSSIMN